MGLELQYGNPDRMFKKYPAWMIYRGQLSTLASALYRISVTTTCIRYSGR